MDYNAQVMVREKTRVIAVKALSFPEGIGNSWKRLEAVYPPKGGRRFYGLTHYREGSLEYFAAVEPPSEDKPAPAGFRELTIDGGPYARVKLMGWPERTAEFSKVFDQLMNRFEFRHGGYSIEFYRSQREAHLMIPVAEGDSLGRTTSDTP